MYEVPVLQSAQSRQPGLVDPRMTTIDRPRASHFGGGLGRVSIDRKSTNRKNS